MFWVLFLCEGGKYYFHSGFYLRFIETLWSFFSYLRGNRKVEAVFKVSKFGHHIIEAQERPKKL
jgi:hypothetical protein